MRELTAHKVNPVNDRIKVTVMDEPGAGGAHHVYKMQYDQEHDIYYASQMLAFQNGPIAEVGVNGITQEILLNIVADRLDCFQKGPYACDANAEALDHIQTALEILKNRTRERMNRGVEGTHKI